MTFCSTKWETEILLFSTGYFLIFPKNKISLDGKNRRVIIRLLGKFWPFLELMINVLEFSQTFCHTGI